MTTRSVARRLSAVRACRRHLALGILLCGAAVWTGCRADSPAAAAAAATTPPPADGHVRLEAAQLKQITVEELSTRAPVDAIKATGTVEFNADRMARVLPPVFGQVQDLAVNVGDAVRKDQVLFVLSSREVASAIADHVASHNDLELAQKTYSMTKDMYDHQAASLMSLQQSQNELAKAQAKVAQTEEALQVLGLETSAVEGSTELKSRIPVRAPLAGTVIERSITNGQFVNPDNPALVTIADLSTVWIEADIFERDVILIALCMY